MSGPRRRRKTRGVSTIELILVLVVLILATFVSLQFGIALIVKQAVAHAATVATREAAKGVGVSELECLINRILAGHQITIGTNASFVLEEGAVVHPQVGTPTFTPPTVTVPLDSDEVRVTLCVNLTAHPILNILSNYGIDYTNRKFIISSACAHE